MSRTLPALLLLFSLLFSMKTIAQDTIADEHIYYATPGPAELAQLHIQNYNSADSILEVTTPDSGFTNDQRIMLMGAYWFDMSLYATIRVGKEVLKRMPMMRKLAAATGAPIAENIEKRLRKHRKNGDSLTAILNECYLNQYEFWNENGQAYKAHLLSAGMMVECVYLSATDIPRTDNSGAGMLYFEKLGLSNISAQLKLDGNVALVAEKTERIIALLPEDDYDIDGMNRNRDDLMTASFVGRQLFLKEQD